MIETKNSEHFHWNVCPTYGSIKQKDRPNTSPICRKMGPNCMHKMLMYMSIAPMNIGYIALNCGRVGRSPSLLIMC